MAFLHRNPLTAPSTSLCLFSLLFLSNTHLLSLSTTTTTADIHDLLPQYGFPRGLIPDAVKSYSLSSDGSFAINLDRSCYVHFDDELVYYDKVVKGKMISYGSVSDMSGIQAKKLFLWVTVTGMTADSDAGMIEFHVGALSEKLPAKQFESIHSCKNKGAQESLVESI
ncbi:hypothetical protein RHGRI_001946 [Rhododendron griersonianum]|uniref:DUF538 family protein n=1 Tax=Rhododendron griersonianum TaxID=479676 RepID=A0AAV6LN96_9ERIC|nr:hypothetical protein RHGRI_001946 [Rhododendron griersonianum]